MPDDFTITIEPQLIATTLPEHLIRRLEAAWAERRPVSFVNSVPGCQAYDAISELFDYVERQLVDASNRELQKNGRTLLTSTGPVWTRLPGVHPRWSPALVQQPEEVPWTRGSDYLAYDELVCRITGVSIPLLEETDREEWTR
jgi:hypothetical protein